MSKEKKITLDEYIAKAKNELDTFAEAWKTESEDTHPRSLTEVEWGEQELASRFEIVP